MSRLVTDVGQRVAELAVALADGDRLSRGRRYQKKGNVSGVFVGTGEAVASVEGSRADPYEVTLAVRPANENVRRAVADGDVLAAVPHPGEVALTCVCPDWGDPCKHGVAALLELAQEIDDDPSLILRWRGIDDVVVAPRAGTEPLDQASPSSASPVGSFDPDDELAARRRSKSPARASIRRALDRSSDPAGGEHDRRDAVRRLRDTMAGELTEARHLVPVEVVEDEPEYPGALAEFFVGAMPDGVTSPIAPLEVVSIDPYRQVRIMLETLDAAPVIADAIESIADHWLGR